MPFFVSTAKAVSMTSTDGRRWRVKIQTDAANRGTKETKPMSSDMCDDMTGKEI